MNIPIEVVRQGDEAVNRFMELAERKGKSYSANRKALNKFLDQMTIIKGAIRTFENKHIHISNPYFSDNYDKWILPDFKELSQITDEIWTYQKNLETLLNDIYTGTFEYIEVTEELDKLY
jgi:hypothetical protein